MAYFQQRLTTANQLVQLSHMYTPTLWAVICDLWLQFSQVDKMPHMHKNKHKTIPWFTGSDGGPNELQGNLLWLLEQYVLQARHHYRPFPTNDVKAMKEADSSHQYMHIHTCTELFLVQSAELIV